MERKRSVILSTVNSLYWIPQTRITKEMKNFIDYLTMFFIGWIIGWVIGLYI